MKGQMNLNNILEMIVGVIFYAVAGYPIVTQVIDSEVINLQANPQPYTAATIFFLQLVPVAIGFGLLALIWFISIPHQEQRGY
jgi:hypothetical protein